MYGRTLISNQALTICISSMCVVSLATWRLFTIVHIGSVVGAVSVAIWCLFTGVGSWCGSCAVCLAN